MFFGNQGGKVLLPHSVLPLIPSVSHCLPAHRGEGLLTKIVCPPLQDEGSIQKEEIIRQEVKIKPFSGKWRGIVFAFICLCWLLVKGVLLGNRVGNQGIRCGESCIFAT